MSGICFHSARDSFHSFRYLVLLETDVVSAYFRCSRPLGEIELQTNPFQRNVLPAMAYFQVGHGLTPSGNSIASKRNLKARWETFALQGGKADSKVDAAFFSKSSADCPFTQCPVWGKPGVFEVR